jgi:hypothetical protein
VHILVQAGAVAIPFLPMLVVGASLLALWVDVRHPDLAPESLSKRMVAAVAALLALQAVPVFHGSAAAVYATVFALVLPALISSFLTAVWLLRALRDAQLGFR